MTSTAAVRAPYDEFCDMFWSIDTLIDAGRHPNASRPEFMLTSAAPSTDAGLESRVVSLNSKISDGIQRGEKMAIHRRIAVALLAMAVGLVSLPAETTAQNQEPKAQQNMVKEIRHQLVLLPWYSVFDNLAFRIEGSKVILIGQVVRPTLKSDAEGAVKSIEGVSSVQNDIEVLPNSPMDNQIRRAVYRAIYSEPGLQRYALSAVPSIHIIVKNGNVTLEGVADNDTDKNLAGLRANGVPNVFSVTNNLVVSK
jgi:hyperosmotically inducible protein